MFHGVGGAAIVASIIDQPHLHCYHHHDQAEVLKGLLGQMESIHHVSIISGIDKFSEWSARNNGGTGRCIRRRQQ